MDYKDLSDEQKAFVNACLYNGRNVLVDACIGSGKTTAIQCLCSLPAMMGKRILYLTYSKLLKEDARAKIRLPGVAVSNYHGYAYGALIRGGSTPSVADSVKMFNLKEPPTAPIDWLILDEYQDIRQDFAEMLVTLKKRNPDMRIAAVGDMAQKLYDDTRIDAMAFIQDFLGANYQVFEFTRCFRLSKDLAAELGDVWNKTIIGVNPEHETRHVTFQEAFDILKDTDVRDILCLGSNGGSRDKMLNQLEEAYPDKFNKNTCWAKVHDFEGSTSPSKDSAVFTTYDGSKGMERDVCVVFDWTEDYWSIRCHMPGAKYEILRNIFCVAASRGKRLTLFVDEPKKFPLSFDTLKEDPQAGIYVKDCGVKELFAFKMEEDLDECFHCLKTQPVQPEGDVIDIPTSDGMIDLSACIGTFMEVTYFDACSINKYILIAMAQNKGNYLNCAGWEDWPLEYKVLYYMAIETHQNRYFHQVRLPFVTESQQAAIEQRLSGRFPRDANAQVSCQQQFFRQGFRAFTATGVIDVVDADNAVMELKFTSAIAREHILQCAVYMLATYRTKGYVWNVKTDEMLEVMIPDRKKFLTAVGKTATKGYFTAYPGMSVKKQLQDFYSQHRRDCREILKACADDTLKESQVKQAFAKRGLLLPGSGKQFIDGVLNGDIK